MSFAIQVQDLEVRYRDKRGRLVNAVRGLTFEVNPGEVVGFLGPNGAGKSSTLKALMGFVSPSAGRATVFGQQAGSLQARSQTGYLPEVAMYYPFLTPRETLRLYGNLQGLPKNLLDRQINELLDLVGLLNAGDKLNRTLSKGMLQRVGIAQALLGDPQLLILDEVTSGLDPIGRQDLRDWLKQRQRDGATLFFSSHEMSEVEQICDRILVIDQGKLIDEHSMENLKAALKTYSVTFRNYNGLLIGATAENVLPDNTRYAQFPTKQLLVQAVQHLTKGNGDVVDIVAESGSLEDYFVETIRSAA